jgi:hypothetical protein
MVVTDNGSNMIEAINTCKQLLKKQAEAAGETIDSGTGTSGNEESVNETETDGAHVTVDTDSGDNETECFLESVRRREGIAQESSEAGCSVSEPSTDSEIDNSSVS